MATLAVVLALAVGGCRTAGTEPTPAPTPEPTPAPTPEPRPAPANTVYVPDSIDSTGATDASAALSAFVANVANDTKIVFKAGGVYRMDHGLKIRNKRDLEFDGDGATLSSNPNTARIESDSLFALWGGNDGIVIHDFHFDGNAPKPGVFDAPREGVAAVLVQGDNVEVYDITAEDLPGDFVNLHESGNDTIWSDNAYIHDVRVTSLGRNCLTVIATQNAVFERVECGVVGYTVFDIEPNRSDQGARNVVFRDNTATSWDNAFVAAEGASGSLVDGVVISGNTVTDMSMLTRIRLPSGRKNITFTDNVSLATARGPVVEFGYIDGLTVTGNTQPLSSGEFAKIWESTNVVYEP